MLIPFGSGTECPLPMRKIPISGVGLADGRVGQPCHRRPHLAHFLWFSHEVPAHFSLGQIHWVTQLAPVHWVQELELKLLGLEFR